MKCISCFSTGHVFAFLFVFLFVHLFSCVLYERLDARYHARYRSLDEGVITEQSSPAQPGSSTSLDTIMGDDGQAKGKNHWLKRDKGQCHQNKHTRTKEKRNRYSFEHENQSRKKKHNSLPFQILMVLCLMNRAASMSQLNRFLA